MGHGGKGKGKGKKVSKFQVQLSGKYEDYSKEEDAILKRAYLVGQPNVRFHLRGQNYEYNFTKPMKQKNLDSGKTRDIRPPVGLTPPSKPLLGTGPMKVVRVKPGDAGKTIMVDDPNNPGQKVPVLVPAGAKPGAQMAVPLPAKGEKVEDVQKKQSGWSTGGKVAAGAGAVAALGAVGVGGVILGDHLAGGDMGADAVDAVADWGEGAGEAVADWTDGAVEDAGEFLGDAGEWVTDAAEDVGDFFMDLF